MAYLAPHYFAPRYFAPHYFAGLSDFGPEVALLGSLSIIAAYLGAFDLRPSLEAAASVEPAASGAAGVAIQQTAVLKVEPK